MKTLVLVRQANPAPMEMTLPFLQAMVGWRERYRSQMESFFFFPGGGGCGVVEMDGETLFQFIAEFPFGPYSTITTEPVVDGDWSLKTQIAVVEQMMAQMSPA